MIPPSGTGIELVKLTQSGESSSSASESSSRQTPKNTEGGLSGTRAQPTSKWKKYSIPSIILILTATVLIYFVWEFITNYDPREKRIYEVLEKCRKSFDATKPYATEELNATAKKELLIENMKVSHSFKYELEKGSLISIEDPPSVRVRLKMSWFIMNGHFDSSDGTKDVMCAIEEVIARLTVTVEAKDQKELLKLSELKRESQVSLQALQSEEIFTQYNVSREKFTEHSLKFIDGFIADVYVPAFTKCFAKPPV